MCKHPKKLQLIVWESEIPSQDETPNLIVPNQNEGKKMNGLQGISHLSVHIFPSLWNLSSQRKTDLGLNYYHLFPSGTSNNSESVQLEWIPHLFQSSIQTYESEIAFSRSHANLTTTGQTEEPSFPLCKFQQFRNSQANCISFVELKSKRIFLVTICPGKVASTPVERIPKRRGGKQSVRCGIKSK